MQARATASEFVVGDLVARHGGRLVRFGLVGASGVLLNYLVLFSLVSGGGMRYLAAAAIASEISVISNFALNDHWTFRDARPNTTWLRRAAQYNAVALGGMMISIVVLATLTQGVGLNYLVANFFALGAATTSNYLLNTQFTWRIPHFPESHLLFPVGAHEFEPVAVPYELD